MEHSIFSERRRGYIKKLNELIELFFTFGGFQMMLATFSKSCIIQNSVVSGIHFRFQFHLILFKIKTVQSMYR